MVKEEPETEVQLAMIEGLQEGMANGTTHTYIPPPTHTHTPPHPPPSHPIHTRCIQEGIYGGAAGYIHIYIYWLTAGGNMCLGKPETVNDVLEALRVVMGEVMERCQKVL